MALDPVLPDNMRLFDCWAFLARHKFPLIFGLIGLICLGIGFWVIFQGQSQDKIEIISSETIQTDKMVFVDIEGAVEKPGVYELPFGARIEDLLIAAGGLAVEADREWVEKTINQAQKLADGTKIYIPKKGDPTSAVSAAASAGSVSGTGSTLSQVNVNTASQSQLETLWGVGPATAQKIITNRPYQSVEELLTKKILKSNVYQRIAEQLTVY